MSLRIEVFTCPHCDEHLEAVSERGKSPEPMIQCSGCGREFSNPLFEGDDDE